VLTAEPLSVWVGLGRWVESVGYWVRSGWVKKLYACTSLLYKYMQGEQTQTQTNSEAWHYALFKKRLKTFLFQSAFVTD